MSKVEMVVWCALLVAALVIGCREERQLILQEEELLWRQREPWTVLPADAAEEVCDED
jgi:hypothetical protein